jgi:hypothetical protein
MIREKQTNYILPILNKETRKMREKTYLGARKNGTGSLEKVG